MPNKKICLVGPVNDAAAEDVVNWRSYARGVLQFSDFDVVDVIRSIDTPLEEEKPVKAREIVTRSLNAVQSSDLVLANLTDIRSENIIPFGTICMIFHAAHNLGLPVVVVANDYDGYWLDFYTVTTVPTLEEALDYIKNYWW